MVFFDNLTKRWPRYGTRWRRWIWRCVSCIKIGFRSHCMLCSSLCPSRIVDQREFFQAYIPVYFEVMAWVINILGWALARLDQFIPNGNLFTPLQRFFKLCYRFWHLLCGDRTARLQTCFWFSFHEKVPRVTLDVAATDTEVCVVLQVFLWSWLELQCWFSGFGIPWFICFRYHIPGILWCFGYCIGCVAVLVSFR